MPVPRATPVPAAGTAQPNVPISSSGNTVGGDARALPEGTNSGISVSLVRQPSLQVPGVITVVVPKDLATAGSGFTFALPAQVAESAAAGGMPVRVTTLTGGQLPGWLRYVPETKKFVASAVPDGAFPFQVVVNIGAQKSTVVISERAQ